MSEEITAESPIETPKEVPTNRINEDRDALYQKFYETEGVIEKEPEAPKVEAPKVDEAPKVEVSDASPKVEATATPADKGDVTVPPPAVGDRKFEDRTKTVPYDALHVEREKRKAATERARKLEEELAAFKAAQTKPKEPVSQEPITDYDGTLRSLQEKIEKQAQELEYLKQSDQQKQVSEYQREMSTAFSSTDQALEKEGYPGFMRLLPQVQQELLRLIQEDPDQDAAVIKRVYDNPEGWKKIFKERIFPDFKGVFVPVARGEKIDSKIDAKKSAALVGSPGRVETPQEPKEEWSAQQYLKDRLKQRMS